MPHERAPSACVPVLRLAKETVLVDQGQGMRQDFREVDTAAIELSFDYDGVRVRASDPGDRIRGGAKGWIARDRAAEAQARRVLEAFGPVEIGALDDFTPLAESQADYVVDPHGDAAVLCSFNSYALPRLRALGWQIEVDGELPVENVEADQWFAALEPDDRGWFELELGVEVEGQRVDLLPLLIELIEQRGDLSRARRGFGRTMVLALDDRKHVVVPSDRLMAMLDVLGELYGADGRSPKGSLRVPELLDSWTEKLDGVFTAQQPLRWHGEHKPAARRAPGVRLPQELEPVVESSQLRATLRPYQRAGLAFLQHIADTGHGGVLADDMGLGKTLQTIAHLVHEKAIGRARAPSLIVVPTSLIGNWRRELRTFAPHLRVVVLHGAGRHRQRADIPGADVVITSYPLLIRDRASFVGVDLHAMIADEAQAIKNVRSQAHQAVKSLESHHRIFLTGTPIENNLDELWALFDLTVPGLLGDASTFRAVFRQPIERNGNRPRLEALRDRIAPYVLRRMKDQVATDLPPKTEIVKMVELRGGQRDLYEGIRIAGHAAVRKAVKQRGIARATIDILGALMKLRQVCCDPRLVRVSAADTVDESSKLGSLMDMVEQMLGQGRRILIFSQFTSMLALIADELRRRDTHYALLTGATDDRDSAVELFQRGRADVFLISLKAGGTGLNLTRADTVIHYDPWWNPAAQNQASDRAYRIGQTQPVFVYKLIVSGSVEERMLLLQQRKQSLADALLASAERGGLPWSESDVDDLFAPLSDEAS